MASIDRVSEGLSVMVLSRQEATALVVLLVGQLAEQPIPGNQCGAAPTVRLSDGEMSFVVSLADNHKARVIGQALTDKCDVCGISDHGNPKGWGIRGTTLHCPQCLDRLERRGAPWVSFTRR
jgi:hypothetical protein